jgi:hypothetical protein
MLRLIERYTGSTIPAHVIPGLEPRARSREPASRRHSRSGMMTGNGGREWSRTRR